MRRKICFITLAQSSQYSHSLAHSPHLRRKASWKGCKLLGGPAASPESESRDPAGNKLDGGGGGDSGGDDDNLKR